MLRMIDVGDLRFSYLGFGRAGVEEELVDLVRADIAEDATELHRILQNQSGGHLSRLRHRRALE